MNSTESSTWNGPYLRYKLDEKGVGVRSGTLSRSPDLIPNGLTIRQDPREFIENLWSQDTGTSTTATRTNYLYVRGANTSAKSMVARVYLYYSPARLLQWPTGVSGNEGWARRPLQTGAGWDYQEVEIAGGERFVTPSAFEWKPQRIADDHYCLVGRVSTDASPNPIPDGLDRIDDFARYISRHPDLAWRNVATLAPANNSWSDSPLYIQGAQTSEMVISVFVTGGRKGDTVTMQSSVGGPNPPIRLREVLQGEPPTEQLNIRTVIPADWTSKIEIVYEAAKGQPVPLGLKTELDVLKVGIDPAGDLAGYARPLRDLGIVRIENAGDLAIPVGATSYSRAVAEPGEAGA